MPLGRTRALHIACLEKDDDVRAIISLFATCVLDVSPPSPTLNAIVVFAMTQNSPLTMNQFRDGVTFHNYVTQHRA